MKLILGHNQFLGISHISEKNASEKDSKFSDPSKILEAVRLAHECGFRQMIVESHPRMRSFMELYEKDGTFDMEFVLQVPFVSGYVRRMAEGGIKGVVKEIISGAPKLELAKIALGAAPKLLRNDYMRLGVRALDLEMSKYSDFEIKGVLMHNVITDILLSLDAEDAYGDFFDRVKRRFGVRAGMITLNLPMLVDHLNMWGLSPDMVMSPINPYGFDMNPSQAEVERCVRSSKYNILAMNVLGGGSVTLPEASMYIKGLRGVQAVVIGASSRKHMEELVTAFDG